MAERGIRSDGVYQRLLSALERAILTTYPTGSCRHRCVDGCCSETQDWDRKNVQQYCQPRTETQASAKYPRVAVTVERRRFGGA